MKYKLKDIGTIITGTTPKTKNKDYYNRKDFLFVGPTDLKIGKYVRESEKYVSLKAYNDYSSRFIGKQSLRIDCIGSEIGNVSLSVDKVLTNQQINSITDINENNFNIEFLYYLFSTMKKYFHQIGTNGSTMPIINKTMFEEIEVEIPNKVIQDKIAYILSKIDMKIDYNIHTNNNLFEIGDAIYIANINRYNNSKLPKDWKTKTLKEVTNNFDFKRKPMSSRERIEHKGKYPYYGATSIIDYVDDFIFDNTYILMGEDGTVITSDNKPVLQYVWGKIWVNNHAHVLQGKNISEEYLYFCLRNTDVKALITGAVQPKINQENMNKLRVIIPDRRTLTEVENKLSTIMKKYKENSNEINILIKIRDALLPKLMNGEIDLDKIEI